MDSAIDKHHQLISDLARPPSSPSGATRVDNLRRLELLRCWLDAREAEILAVAHEERDDLDHGARSITQLAQQTARITFGQAKRRATRAAWLVRLPETASALDDGRLGTAQADELCLLADRLDAHLFPLLEQHEERLVSELAAMTPTRAARRLRAFESDLDDDDGKSRLEKQRRANHLRFARQSDGTTSMFGRLDPVSDAKLRTCIDAKVAEFWRGTNAVDDPTATPPAHVTSNEQLRARALVELVCRGHAAGPGARGHAEILVLIDYRTLLGQLSVAQTSSLGDGSPIPADVIRQLACEANIIPVVLGSKGVPLDVGRGTRLATAGQRSALRAMYQTCCVKSCEVAFDYCEIHHIDWWRHGGSTNLANLAPVCSDHHHLIHDHGWQLSLDPERVGQLRSPWESGADDSRPSGPTPPPTTDKPTSQAYRPGPPRKPKRERSPRRRYLSPAQSREVSPASPPCPTPMRC